VTAQEALQLLAALYEKYGSAAPKLLEVIHDLQAHDNPEALADATELATQVLGFFGLGNVAPLIGLGITGIQKLISIIKASGQEWTPEMIVAKAAELKAADDVLDSKFDLPGDTTGDDADNQAENG